MKLFVSFLSGLLFGLGLCLASMTDPRKVQAFLDLAGPWDPSLALVPIDEAFSKMDTGRIKDCIEAIRDLDLQGAFSMSTGNVPAAFSLCQQLIVVSRHEERRGNRPYIRNVPVSILRDSEEGREWMEEHV